MSKIAKLKEEINDINRRIAKYEDDFTKTMINKIRDQMIIKYGLDNEKIQADLIKDIVEFLVVYNPKFRDFIYKFYKDENKWSL